MILSFADDSFDSYFEKGKVPRLLTASYINVDFSKFTRLLHNHSDRLELLLIRSGSGTYIVEDERYNIQPGNLIVTNAGVLHDEVPEYTHQLSMLAIGIDNVHIKGLPKNHLIASNIIPVIKIDEEFPLVDTIFKAIFDSLSSSQKTLQESTHYLAQALLSLVVHSFEEHGHSNPPVSKQDLTLFKNIKKYIDDNYSEDLSIPKISERFFISHSYLSHLFKRKLGYSPMQYVARRRIGEAQSLLVLTNKSITEVAFTVGFDNSSHFNVQFKKYVGLSPMLYRKQYLLHDSEIKEKAVF